MRRFSLTAQLTSGGAGLPMLELAYGADSTGAVKARLVGFGVELDGNGDHCHVALAYAGVQGISGTIITPGWEDGSGAYNGKMQIQADPWQNQPLTMGPVLRSFRLRGTAEHTGVFFDWPFPHGLDIKGGQSLCVWDLNGGANAWVTFIVEE